MSIFSEFKKALKIAKKINEIKKYFDKNAISKELHEDIAALKDILERMAKKVDVFKDLWELIFK